MCRTGFFSWRDILAAGLLIAATSACSPPDSASDTATRKSAAMDISAPEAHRRAQAGELALIDIRRPEEWRNTGVAQGAARINMLHPGGPQGFSDAVLKQVNGNHDAPIGLICRTGNRTAQMQSELRGSGFTQVYNIKEGMSGSAAGPGWIRQGLPVVPCDNC
jgi:rhodanese-related sulfurtransferase